MRNFVVITTIFEPTEAVKSFASNKNCRLIIVADRKTPSSWKQEGSAFLSLDAQRKDGNALGKLIPLDHYSRKMLGYLKAMHDGADSIIDADDDIYPKPDWSFPDFDGNYDTIDAPGFINIYQYFTKQKIWPRGLPPEETEKPAKNKILRKTRSVRVGVWQGLSDKQPDVDAIFRLHHDQEYYFEEADPIVLDSNTISPFNSQNTSFRKEVFPLLYLPSTVSFRFTDILRSYIAQPILWNKGFNLGFVQANTIQHRNRHDTTEDLLSEIPMYQNAGRISGIVSDAIIERNSIADNLFLAYRALIHEKIAGETELAILEAWLKECQNS
jgi:hypothetical protein